MSDNPKDQLLLLGALAAVAGIVILADLIIFVRWLQHRYKVYAVEQQYDEYVARYVPESGWQHPAEWLAAAQAQLRPPFAPTWSLIDPFIGFQLVFGVIQIVATAALMPLILRDPLGAQAAIVSAPGIIIQAVSLILMNALFAGIVVFYVARYDARQQAIEMQLRRDSEARFTKQHASAIEPQSSDAVFGDTEEPLERQPGTVWRRCLSALKSIGLGKPSPRLIALGLGLGLALFAVAAAAESGLTVVLPHLLPKPMMDTLLRLTQETTAGGMFGKIHSLPIKILFALAGAVAAPIGEELFFRGFLYNALKRRLNVWPAIVISGLVFALVHFGPLAVLVIFPMGMLLAYVYERTRSLWVTITMHAVNNGLAFILAMTLPHLGEPPAQKAKPVHPSSGHPGIHRSVSQEDAPLNRRRSPPAGERK